jgi:allantoate deiminase
MSDRAWKAIQVCRDLAKFTEEPGRITRTFLSPPMRDVHRLLGDWMKRIGMRVTLDAVGNLRGSLGGAKRLIIGSHLDTVPNAGAFDGILGVVMGLTLAQEWKPGGMGLEVVGFSEEEGVRFGWPFLGSRAFVGTLDDPGNDVRQAIRAFGLDPVKIPEARLAPGAIGFLEFHIEQGPVLESLDLPVGLVDAIAGQSRLDFTFTGEANHAGTTPAAYRKDSLAGAAEWIVAVENAGGTVGRIQNEPNATNVIPGLTRASLDMREASDQTRRTKVERLIEVARQIAARRGIEVSWEERMDQPAVPMNEGLRNKLAMAVEAAGQPLLSMTSGAGHDAMIVAPHVPTAMLFLRSPGGISHSPDENVLEEDVEAALAVGTQLLSCLP